MTPEQKALIEKENHFRHLFAESPSSSELQDAHLLLENVFMHENEYVYQDETEEEKRVPKVLTQCRRLGLTGKAIVSQNEFMSRWTTFTNGILNGLDWTNVFCAGGAILANLIADNAGYNSSDIDLFLYGLDTDEAANAKLREIHALIVRNTGARGDVIRTARAVTILNSHPFRHVQVVLRCYKSPAEVLLGFDIDSCTVGFDGQNVYCMERFKRALTKRYNLVNISRRSLTYEQRLYKYSRRGFAVAVPNLDKNRVNSDIFKKQVKELFGLSKLLLYDYLAQQQIHLSRTRPEAKMMRIEHQTQSDYNGEMEIPWGPHMSTQRILSILKLKDKRQFFGQLTKIKRDAQKAGTLGQASQKKPEHLFETIFLDTQAADGTKTSKIEWIRNNPAYQDIDGSFTRPLMTGSFQLPPPVQAVWDLESYDNAANSAPQGLSKDQGFVPGQWEPEKGVASPFSKATAASPVAAKATNAHTRGGFMSSETAASTGGGMFSNMTDLSAFGGPSATAASFGVYGSQPSFGTQATPSTSSFGGYTAAPAAEPSVSPYFSPQKFTVAKKKSPEPKKKKEEKAMPAKSVKATAAPSAQFGFPTASTPQFPSQASFAPLAASSQPATPFMGDMGALMSAIESLKPFILAAIKDSSSLQPPTGQEEAPPTTKLLLLVSLCYKQGSLTQDEKNTLKDLIIARNEAVYAALEVFEVDQDIEELVDTFKRVIKVQSPSASF